jgi:hypothetical protein
MEVADYNDLQGRLDETSLKVQIDLYNSFVKKKMDADAREEEKIGEIDPDNMMQILCDFGEGEEEEES